MPYMMTRIQVDDFAGWKSMFDGDAPGARRAATGHRLFRGVEDPGQVFIAVEFDTADDAVDARERLVASGVLERVNVRSEPTIVEEIEAVAYERAAS